MKKLQFLIATLLATACLVLAILTVKTSRANVQKQQALTQTQAQIAQIRDGVQNEVRTLQSTEQMSQNVLTDLGRAALSNEAVRSMLLKNGYSLQTNTPNPVAAALPVVEAKTLPSAKPANEVVSPAVSAPVEDAKQDAKKEDKP